MILYISGPMQGLPDFNYPAFHNSASLLHLRGYETLNPADNVNVDSNGKRLEWEDFMRLDIPQVCRADGIALLPGWHRSRGARVEIYVASILSIPIMPIEMWRQGMTEEEIAEANRVIRETLTDAQKDGQEPK